MSDQAQAPLDLPSIVMKAPEPLWKQIRQALGVQTREQAAELVQTNEEARNTVSMIVSRRGASPAGKTLATSGTAPAGRTLATTAQAEQPTSTRARGKVEF